MKFSKLVIATHNQGKLREFRSLFAGRGWDIAGLSDLPIHGDYPETGSSFAENARLKALYYSRYTALPVLADDSGLEVYALGGRPGIYSARYAGTNASDSDRIRTLLHDLQKTGGERRARFICALALAQGGVLLLETEGECEGEIIEVARGTNGFGYDPVFLIPTLGKTYAELGEAEKNRCSHRARAVRSLLEKLSCRPSD